MKTYKVIFTTFAAMVLGAFVITSCYSEENAETQVSSNSVKREGVLDLSEDPDFVELYNLVSEYATKEKDTEQINYLLLKLKEMKRLAMKKWNCLLKVWDMKTEWKQQTICKPSLI